MGKGGLIVLILFFAVAAFAADTTPPVLTITSPANGAVVSSSTVTITGTASDAGSGLATLTCNGDPVTVQADNSFSQGPLALKDGFNTFTLIARDNAGNRRQQALNVIRQCTNLVQDPGFESGVSGFVAQDSSSNVSQTNVAPLEGAHSLRIAINGYGNNLWWDYLAGGRKGTRLSVSAHLRSDVASPSSLKFCAFVNYNDGTQTQSCA